MLRCFQHLSRPHIATQRCPWQNNWYTSGASIPVQGTLAAFVDAFYAKRGLPTPPLDA